MGGGLATSAGRMPEPGDKAPSTPLHVVALAGAPSLRPLGEEPLGRGAPPQPCLAQHRMRGSPGDGHDRLQGSVHGAGGTPAGSRVELTLPPASAAAGSPWALALLQVPSGSLTRASPRAGPPDLPISAAAVAAAASSPLPPLSCGPTVTPHTSTAAQHGASSAARTRDRTAELRVALDAALGAVHGPPTISALRPSLAWMIRRFASAPLPGEAEGEILPGVNPAPSSKRRRQGPSPGVAMRLGPMASTPATGGGFFVTPRHGPCPPSVFQPPSIGPSNQRTAPKGGEASMVSPYQGPSSSAARPVSSRPRSNRKAAPKVARVLSPAAQQPRVSGAAGPSPPAGAHSGRASRSRPSRCGLAYR